MNKYENNFKNTGTMKTTIITLIACLIATFTFAETNPANDAKMIKDIIEKAYVQGLNNGNDIKAVKEYIHDDFECRGIFNGKMTRVTKKDCLNRIKQIRTYPKTFDCRNYSADIKMVDVTGDSAIVKLILKNKDRECYVEYLSLVKEGDKWLIVNKVYSLPTKSYHEEG